MPELESKDSSPRSLKCEKSIIVEEHVSQPDLPEKGTEAEASESIRLPYHCLCANQPLMRQNLPQNQSNWMMSLCHHWI